ncbi:MAG TPA: protein kinase [Gemmatimonadales bacterium]|nr:protein kinase [Gemmatimonadales bacterium]
MTEPLARLSAALEDRYRVERKLGEGGMATVYLAEDLRHHRHVALKVLRPELAAVIGAERFLHEITTTANLQHPHILPLHDSGQVDGSVFYVMPFVEGESLRDRLNREKQLPVEDAIRITREVASALDYAHRHGIIHRDIKPENILLHDGSALVADFGIALAASHTGDTRMTETGMSLGTPHYMSPEQAMGERTLDARSDIYALGCVCYEMLAGEPPFTGPTAQAVVARVLTEEPRSLTLQRKTIPPSVADAVEVALSKLPADRFATAAQFAEALEGRSAGPSRQATAARAAARIPARAARWRDPLVLGLAFVAIAALAATVTLARRRPPSESVPPLRFVIATPDSAKPFDGFPWPAAISPDGSVVVYTVTRGTTRMFYALRTDQLDAHPIPGTEEGSQPLFSPDGQWLAFEVPGKERKVRLDGSAPVTMAEGGANNGADWTTGGELVVGATGGSHGLSRVSAAGGELAEFTVPDTAKGDKEHVWPIALPDGKHIVFVLWTGANSTSQLALTSLDDGKVVPLGLKGMRPLAVLDGVLVYVQADGSVMAVTLDVGGSRVTGKPVPVLDPVTVVAGLNGNSGVFLSRGGALVTSRGLVHSQLAVISPDGRTVPVLAEPRAFLAPRWSPDGRRIAVLVAEQGKSDVWIYDVGSTTFSRLTTSGTAASLQWTADGSRVVFAAAGANAGNGIFSQRAEGGSPPKLLAESSEPTPWGVLSSDDKQVVVQAYHQTSWDVFRFGLDSGSTGQGYLTTRANETNPAFSPDGKWVALGSDESGKDEIYVRSFPDPSFRTQVSVAGGFAPAWSADGSRLYYRAGDALLAARIAWKPAFQVLSRDTLLSATKGLRDYDVSRDGKRVLALLSNRDDFQLVVAPNWITEFRRRMAASRPK